MKDESRPKAAPGDRLAGGSDDDSTAGPDPAVRTERAALGMMLAPAASADLAGALDRLEPGDFADPCSQWLFRVIARMAADGIRPDSVTLPAYVRRHGIDGAPLTLRHIGSICAEITGAAPAPVMLPFMVDSVLTESARRRIDAAGAELRRLAAGADVTELEQTARAELDAVLTAIGRVSAC